MSDLKLDTSSRDLVIENGDFVLLSSDVGAETRLDWIRQGLECHLKQFLGEWFLQTDDGVPYFQEILRKNPNPQVIEAIFKERIVSFPAVLEILKFELDYDGASRTLTLSSLEVRVTEGIITFTDLTLGA